MRVITTPPPASVPITAEHFPTPGLVLRTNDTTAQHSLREFAHRQAEGAASLYRTLVTELCAARGHEARTAIFTSAFEAAEHWRYQVAAASPHQAGRYGTIHAERFRTPITDDNPNYFRIGEHERLRDGARWNPSTRTYVGGAETPASRTMRHIGTLAAARFAHAPDTDVVSNPARLPGNVVVQGMRLLRGSPARHAAAELATRIAARGGDTSRIITDGDLLYTASSSETEQATIFHGAMALLANDHATRPAALTAWVRAAYLLYQAPRRKRGCDATIRTFLIAAGAVLLGRPPVLRHDLDLRAYVQLPSQFVTGLRAVQDRNDAGA